MTNPDFNRFWEQGRSNDEASPLGWRVWTTPDDMGVFFHNRGDAGFEWTNAHALFWNLLDNPQVLCWPEISDRNWDDGRGIWQAALDLLAYGHGVPNLRELINAWAGGGLQVIDEPIYGFLRRNLGPSLWALVWYLNEHDYVVDHIENYLSSFALDFSGDPEANEQPFVHGTSYYRPADILGWLHSENIVERFPFARVLTDGGGSDPAHLSHHFTFEGIPEPEMKPEVEWLSDFHAQVVINDYTHWYKRLHQALARGGHDSLSLLEGLEHPEFKVDVWIQGIGFLGQFKLGHYGLLYRAQRINGLGVAHRFGPQRVDMQERPELDGNRSPRRVTDPNDMDFGELVAQGKLWVHVKSDVGFAHSLELEIDETSWFRSEGQWTKEALPADTSHFKHCLAEMVKAGLLDLEDAPLEQVLDDTLLLEIQGWAKSDIIELWDTTPRFHKMFAAIGSWQPDAPIDEGDVSELDDTNYMSSLLKQFERKIRSSDEQTHLVGLYEFFKNPPTSPKELLSDLIVAFDYFGDPTT